MKFNHKEIGIDRFEIEDVECLDDKQLLEYQIAVMQWYKDGGEVQLFNKHFKQRITSAKIPIWNWSVYHYLPVPKPSYEERQAKWVEENGAKVGDKVKCLPFKSCQDGYKLNVGSAHEFFGKMGEIRVIDGLRLLVQIADQGCSFPYFALELVKPQYKPYEKADPAWLVKTDEVMKVKNEDWFTRVAEINNTIKCETDRHLAIRTASGWLSVDEAFNCYEWYNIATGETRPFGEQI